jgi:hypothetical protein
MTASISHDFIYDGTRVPAFVVDLIPGAPAALAAYDAARGAEDDATLAHAEASKRRSAAAHLIARGLAGASHAEADAAAADRDAAAGVLTAATRARRRAESARVELIRDGATSAEVRSEAARRAVDAHERAERALADLTAATRDLDDARKRSGVSAAPSTPEDAMLAACEALGLDDATTRRRFIDAGMTPPEEGRVVARRAAHHFAPRTTVAEAVRVIADSVAATPVESLRIVAAGR